MRRNTNVLAIVLLIAGVCLLSFSLLSVPEMESVNPPDGFEKVYEGNISGKYIEIPLYEFELDKDTNVSFYIWSKASGNKTIKLTDSGNFTAELLSGENDITNASFTLQNGSYKIILSNDEYHGSLYIYMKKQ